MIIFKILTLLINGHVIPSHLFMSSLISLINVLYWYFRRRQWHPTPVLVPGKSHGWRSLEGCRPWGRWGSDITEQLHFHFSLPCIGEGNGNPLQYSCLENPRDGGAWWASVCRVAQSWTRLKRLSSSSSSKRARKKQKTTWFQGGSEYNFKCSYRHYFERCVFVKHWDNLWVSLVAQR